MRFVRGCVLVVFVGLLLGLWGGALPALALSPWWHLTSSSRPSELVPGGEGQIVLTAANLGVASVDGGLSPVVVGDVLPAGLTGVSIEGVAGNDNTENRGPVKCVLASLSCEFAGTLPPYELIEVRIGVRAAGNVSEGEVNGVSVSGGGAQDASISRPLRVAGEGEATPFGVGYDEISLEEEGGVEDTQAGSHPFQLTTTLTLNQAPAAVQGGVYFASPAALVKDLHFRLPPGLIGNPSPFVRCTLAEFLTPVEENAGNECPPQAAIGVAMVTVDIPFGAGEGTSTLTTTIYNLEPAVGEPARFGFLVDGIVPVTLQASIRTGGDYGVTVSSDNISEEIGFLGGEFTFWGVPGDSRHDSSRGSTCLREARGESHVAPCLRLEERRPPPFMVLPTSCSGSLQTSVEADSWQEPKPSGQGQVFAGELIAGMDGCNQPAFSPSVRLTPDGTAGSTPTGLSVDVHVPQGSVLVAKGLAESAVKDITVALPEGVAVNPSDADGLQACSQAQVGFTGVEAGTDLFTAGRPEPFCANAAKIGTVEIVSPLLPAGQHVKGAVYLATQNENPFGSLLAAYIVAEDPISGFLVKLAGEVRLTESGQLISTFKNTPQLAFEDAELHFFGGERAPLTTPAHCGLYTTSAIFTPWARNEQVPSESRFQITTGPHASACPPASLPFAPSLTAGSVNIQAGAFTPFTTTISREDGSQNLQAIALQMPPGLSGLLTGVKLCPEEQADTGTCGPESEIGETTVSVGVGGDPYSVKGGKVFITGPYQGAPFGLSIVNPAKAGPFDLAKDTACDCVLVRAKIEVNPTTAALTITSDTTGPFKIPSILKGIPLQIQHVNVTINRPGFTFNPTNCSPLHINATITGTETATQALSVPLQVTNCATLAFKPSFHVSTSGKTSKLNGASLTVNLAYPKAPFGTQANIAKVKVDLPKQLPSRLTTLQKACLAATFQANPASCPTASIVGHAKVTTPLLPVPLEGPAYFVSHGGEAFPSLTLVLQGYGVTVDLVGSTFIKKGITSSTFKNTPDVPFNTFNLTLPEGKYSALAANGNLCKTKLTMPTAFTAQNGQTIHQNTPITTTNCPKPHKTPKHKKH